MRRVAVVRVVVQRGPVPVAVSFVPVGIPRVRVNVLRESGGRAMAVQGQVQRDDDCLQDEASGRDRSNQHSPRFSSPIEVHVSH